ncbi:tetratricopeptide repeat protein [Stakelama sediminis]|uniref:Ancillary SecYEG translocon subunit/Cell division coordinator CpoB TPR domain-containing protein n=1 Tax=Stakelama sediminis TaxID=463200 RepID=A0A840YVQ2_9SPHN|nr:tetratricopeptide repeat protein [Stakelama sediminis]MBB5717635.1 hypothetical protein [Stakelama sediminis]
MAQSPQSNEVFFREVDEELRREELAEFGKRWGLWIAVAVVLAIVAAGGWMYWQHHHNTIAGEQGRTYDDALKQLSGTEPQKAAQPLAKLADSKIAGYRAMALFSEGDMLLDKGDEKGAAAKFASIAADNSLPQPYRDLATIRETAVQFDTMKPDAIIHRLSPLATKGSPWFGSAGEMVAIAYLRANRRDLAGKMFGDIAAADKVPDSIRQRAVQMAAVLGVDAVDKYKGADTDAKDKTAG